jgi:hypothetical protein
MNERPDFAQRLRGMAERHPLAVAVLLSAVVGLLIVSPFLVKGNASGHDFEFHLWSWMDAAHSWHAGVWFPRWAEQANWNYGEPRFVFYPPVSWMLGAALSLVLPWKMVPGAFIVVALTLAGVTMFRLAREYLPAADSVVAGALFAANPYHMVVVYWRSAFAELLVSALFPLVVLYALRLPRQRWRAVAPLALVFGLIWLTNVPGALMTSYALALLLAVIAWQERSARPLLFGGLAIAVGLMLAAVYIVPAAAEQPWVRIRDVLSAGLKPDENFLFSRSSDELHTAFNSLVSWVAVIQIVAMAIAFWAARSMRVRLRKLWWPLVVLGVFASVIMTRITSPLWRLVPKAEFIQFPWRWLVVLSFSVAFLATASFVTRQHKILQWVLAAVLLLVIGRWLTAKFEWWDPGGVDDTIVTVHDIGYEGSDEYAPLATDHTDLKQEQPQTAFLRGDTTVEAEDATEVHSWGPEEKAFSVEAEKPERLVLRLLWYPAWKVEVNGRVAAAEPREDTGEMVVPLAAGKNEIRLRLVRTKDRTAGGWVSALGLLLLLVVGISSRSRAVATPG